MPTRTLKIQHVFETVSQRLLREHPDDQPGRMLRAPGLKTAGKFYAFVTNADVVVKLPATRVAELIGTGKGQPCAPARGRPMREWVRLVPADEHTCAAYLLEARGFVAAQTK